MRQNIDMKMTKSKYDYFLKNISKILYFVYFLVIMMVILHFFIIFKTENIFAESENLNNQIHENIIVKTEKIEKDENIFPKVTFNLNGKIFNVDFKNICFSNNKNKNFSERVDIMNFAVENGFEKYVAIKYSFPEIENVVEKIYKNTFKEPQNANLDVIKNSAKTVVSCAKKGSIIDKIDVYNEIYDNFQNFKSSYFFNIKIKEIEPEFSDVDVSKINKIRSEFQTDFKNSSDSRKNNIRKALSSLDGKVLFPGEILSFNHLTGNRNKENGYEKAKIIKNGVFEEEFGGGVCQVSSTLYNASLLADLEIVESHNHSLSVSYVQTGFDAMVNMGSSDLLVKNNLNFPVLFATSSKDDICLIRIFGCENLMKIVRKSKKISENLQIQTFFTSENEKYNVEPVFENDVVLKEGKPGFVIESWVEYYVDDVLLKIKNLRKSSYSPTKKIVLVPKGDKRCVN